jgi:hypothetical protein
VVWRGGGRVVYSTHRVEVSDWLFFDLRVTSCAWMLMCARPLCYLLYGKQMNAFTFDIIQRIIADLCTVAMTPKPLSRRHTNLNFVTYPDRYLFISPSLSSNNKATQL